LQVRQRARPGTVALLAVAGVCAGVAFGIVWALWLTGPSGGNVFIPTLRWLGPVAAVGVALIAGCGLAWWGNGRLRLRGALAGVALILVLVSVPGRLLGIGTGQIGSLSNGIRTEWFSFGSEFPLPVIDTTVITDWTSTRMDAAAWLSDRAAPDDLLATNLTRGAFVSGVTRLPTFVSAIGYQAPYGFPEAQATLLDRERQAWEFIDRPAAASLRPLCRDQVRWLWIDPALTAARSWEPWAAVVLEHPDVILARIDAGACQQASSADP